MKAAIFDLDDTLVTEKGGRKEVIKPVKSLVKSVNEAEGYRTVILTARAESVRDQTEKILDKCGIEFDKLFMRPEDDFALSDERFKEGIVQKLEKDGYEISFVVEDKSAVADMFWRNGIKCLKMPERHALKHNIIRKLRKIYGFMPEVVQRYYINLYQKKFS